MSKSYVTLEQKVCVVCGAEYDTGTILLDKRLKATFDLLTVTGYGMCDDHKKLREMGYVALIEADRNQSKVTSKIEEGEQVERIEGIENAARTGKFAHVGVAAFAELFNMLPPKEMVVYGEIGLIEKLRELAGERVIEYGNLDEALAGLKAHEGEEDKGGNGEG